MINFQYKIILMGFYKTLLLVYINQWIKINFFRIQLSNDETACKFFKKSAQRGDTGLYEVKMKNSEGEDSLPVKIIVLDRPGACEGPLEAVETTKNSVTLQWKPPKDDGGAELTGSVLIFLSKIILNIGKNNYYDNTFLKGYVIEKCLEGTDKWEKCPGIFIQPKATLKHLDEGKSFKFRVRAENPYGEGEPLETKTHIVVKPPYGKMFIYSLLV